MRAASLRHDFWVDDEVGASDEQMDISGRYECETDSQERITALYAAGDANRNCLKVLQEALQHPEVLLMHLNASDDQVLSLQVVGRAGGLPKRVGVEQEDFVAFNEVSDEILRWRALNSQFFDSRSLGKGLQAAVRQNVQGAQSLRKLVDRLEKFFVLLLKGRVKLEEIWSLDIPMRKVRLSHQGIRIGQEGL